MKIYDITFPISSQTPVYEGDPNVTVIVDRRKSERRELGSTGGGQREVRDRRRPRVAGEFPPIDPQRA